MLSNTSELQIRERLSKVSNRDDILDLADLPREDVQKMVLDLTEAKENEKEVKDNKGTGTAVEEIIQKMLEKTKIKFTIIHDGADIELWPVQEGWDGGIIMIPPYKIEIKFSTSNRARISRKQAATARYDGNNYFVLIVEGDAFLKENLLNYTEASPEKQEELSTVVVSNSRIVQGIAEKLIEAPFPEELEPDINGYWIKRELWKHGKELTAWLLSLKLEKRVK